MIKCSLKCSYNTDKERDQGEKSNLVYVLSLQVKPSQPLSNPTPKDPNMTDSHWNGTPDLSPRLTGSRLSTRVFRMTPGTRRRSRPTLCPWLRTFTLEHSWFKTWHRPLSTWLGSRVTTCTDSVNLDKFSSLPHEELVSLKNTKNSGTNLI